MTSTTERSRGSLSTASFAGTATARDSWRLAEIVTFDALRGSRRYPGSFFFSIDEYLSTDPSQMSEYFVGLEGLHNASATLKYLCTLVPHLIV